VKINWNKNIEPHIQAEIDRYLQPALWLVPGWVQSVWINLWGSDNASGEASISINANYDYRNVVLDFYTIWLNQSHEEKTMQMLHELLHIHLSLIADYSRDKINLLCPSNEAEKFNASLQEGLRERHESATQDLALIIFEKLYDK
jgi:hypothetical protein